MRLNTKRSFIIPFLTLTFLCSSCEVSSLTSSSSGEISSSQSSTITSSVSSTSEETPNFDVLIEGIEPTDNIFFLKKNNDVSIYSFNDKIQVPSRASWKLFFDVTGSQEIVTKTINLEIGNNNVYLLVDFGNSITRFYSITVRRLNMFTVTFNTNGGSEVLAQTVQEESFVNQVTPPVKTGYQFAGWDYDFNSPVLNNLTINALWSANSILVHFDSQNGNIDYNEKTYFYDQVISFADGDLPIPSKDYYEFIGWRCGDRTFDYGDSEFVFDFNEEVTFVALYTPTIYSITYLNYEYYTIWPQTYTVEDAFDLPSVDRAMYTFQGWRDQNSNVINSIALGMHGDLVLSAVFDPYSFTITFDVGGSPENIEPMVVYYGQLYSLPTPIPPTAYEFSNWRCENASISSQGTYWYDHDICVTAIYKAIHYSITYVLNGGTNSPKNVTDYTVAWGPALYPATRDGYTFECWTLNGNPIESIPTGTYGDLVLVANWIPIE